VTLKQKVRLFVKIQAATFAIGLAFIIRENAEHGFTLQMTYNHVREALFGDEDPSRTRWLFLLPLFGTFLYFIRTDRRPRNMKQVFFKWSILFLIMEFTTEWTKFGWGQATSDFPVLLVRYAAGGALAAAVWWLIERSPRTHPDSFYKPYGHGHHHGHHHGHAPASAAEPAKRGH
jgi:hypothetical protein